MVAMIEVDRLRKDFRLRRCGACISASGPESSSVCSSRTGLKLITALMLGRTFRVHRLLSMLGAGLLYAILRRRTAAKGGSV